VSDLSPSTVPENVILMAARSIENWLLSPFRSIGSRYGRDWNRSPYDFASQQLNR
jgi:hypothetical protein